jgi:hypothetical protein
MAMLTRQVPDQPAVAACAGRASSTVSMASNNAAKVLRMIMRCPFFMTMPCRNCR